MIVSSSDAISECVITGLAGKKGFSVVTIEKDMMNSEIGFGKRVLEALEKCEICFEHLPSGIDTMSVVLNSSDIIGKSDFLLTEICRLTEPDMIDIEDNLALIAVVGRNMVKAKGTAARVFAALANASINIKMIDQGSSELNIVIGVDEADYIAAINTIYSEFVKA
jgi:aspartate kinase